jgi:hypothetical protein
MLIAAMIRNFIIVAAALGDKGSTIFIKESRIFD